MHFLATSRCEQNSRRKARSRGLLWLVVLVLHGCDEGPPPREKDAVGTNRDAELEADVLDADGGVGDAQLNNVAPDAGESDAGHEDASSAADVGPEAAGQNQDASSDLGAISVLRGDPARSAGWDLTLRGEGLIRHEGKVVSVRIGSLESAPERLGSGQARVRNGAFTLTFPSVWEPQLYKRKLAFIDVNQNMRCDPETDVVFADFRAARAEVLVLREPAQIQVDELPLSSNPDDDCARFTAVWPSE